MWPAESPSGTVLLARFGMTFGLPYGTHALSCIMNPGLERWQSSDRKVSSGIREPLAEGTPAHQRLQERGSSAQDLIVRELEPM